MEKTLFSDNSMTVTVNEYSKNKSYSSKKLVAKNSISINVEDVLKMLAGYQISPHNIASLKEMSGKCIICGSNTNSEMRNICFDCHGKHIKNIYDLAIKAIKENKDSFTYDW